MSRLSRGKVWFQWFYHSKNAVCPSCKESIMLQDCNYTWEIEHIIKMSHGGPDIYPNVIPICPNCNQKNRPYENTFQYMVVIGTMSESEYETQVRNHQEKINQWIANPKCEHPTQKGPRCTRHKSGKDEIWCSQHIQSHLKPMDWEPTDVEISVPPNEDIYI